MGRGGGIWIISVLFTSIFQKPKTTLKNKFLKRELTKSTHSILNVKK